METNSLIALILFFAASVACVGFKIAHIIRRVRMQKRQVVVARVKNFENGVWMCKFFLYGNHVGFFVRKPSGDRVNAYVVGYDEKKQIYKLKELKTSKQLGCM